MLCITSTGNPPPAADNTVGELTSRPPRRGESDGQARGRAAERVVDGLRLARAATTCRRRAWDRQRVSPVVPARKSCPPAPPIAAMRWAACRRSRFPTAGAVRESAAEGPNSGYRLPAGCRDAAVGSSRRAAAVARLWSRGFHPIRGCGHRPCGSSPSPTPSASSERGPDWPGSAVDATHGSGHDQGAGRRDCRARPPSTRCHTFRATGGHGEPMAALLLGLQAAGQSRTALTGASSRAPNVR